MWLKQSGALTTKTGNCRIIGAKSYIPESKYTNTIAAKAQGLAMLAGYAKVFGIHPILELGTSCGQSVSCYRISKQQCQINNVTI
jgi:hypothetical protein